MTTTGATEATEATAARDAGGPSPSQAFGMALNGVVGAVASRLERTAAGWADKLESVAGSGGVAERAGVEGVKAHLQGKDPARAALKGVWQEGSPAVRAAVVTAAVGGVVLLLLSPALLLVYLLAWLVVAAAHRAQTTRQRRPQTA